jgi:hypothetical protein
MERSSSSSRLLPEYCEDDVVEDNNMVVEGDVCVTKSGALFFRCFHSSPDPFIHSSPGLQNPSRSVGILQTTDKPTREIRVRVRPGFEILGKSVGFGQNPPC